MTKPVVVRSIENAPGVLHVNTHCGNNGPVGSREIERLSANPIVAYEISPEITAEAAGHRSDIEALTEKPKRKIRARQAKDADGAELA